MVRDVTSPPGDPQDRDERVLVLLPTYNERENVEVALDGIARAQPTFDVLVIDDASPDGTGEIADARARQDARVHVLHRPGKEGLGRAYVDGFRWALASDRSYTHVFEMDADSSHDPRYLGSLLGACRRGADVALGSRYVPGGGVRDWGPHRRLLSRGGSLYARTVLGVPIRDLTGGFKCFRRAVLEALPLDEIFTVGYGFQIELTYRALRMGFDVVEVPIIFPDRVRGVSKMSMRIFLEGLTSVWKLRFSELHRA
jgi:dolichol-phosphate mannosyltransferase